MIGSEQNAKKTWRLLKGINFPGNALYGCAWVRAHWRVWFTSTAAWMEPFIARKWFWKTCSNERKRKGNLSINEKCLNGIRTWFWNKTLRNHILRMQTRSLWRITFLPTLPHFGVMREKMSYFLDQNGMTSGPSSGIGESVRNACIGILGLPISKASYVDCEKKFGTQTRKHF